MSLACFVSERLSLGQRGAVHCGSPELNGCWRPKRQRDEQMEIQVVSDLLRNSAMTH